MTSTLLPCPRCTTTHCLAAPPQLLASVGWTVDLPVVVIALDGLEDVPEAPKAHAQMCTCIGKGNIPEAKDYYGWTGISRRGSSSQASTAGTSCPVAHCADASSAVVRASMGSWSVQSFTWRPSAPPAAHQSEEELRTEVGDQHHQGFHGHPGSPPRVRVGEHT